MTSIPVQTHFYDPHIAARAKIDEEISQLEARLISLKSSRNALAPIGRLHPEVLQEIFFFVQHTSDYKGREALLLTWISHHWRELAHNTLTLWSYIDFTHPEWVKSALSRTKGCGLEFSFDTTNTKASQNLATSIPYTLGNMPRIKNLKLLSQFNLSDRAFPDGASEWLLPAPLLEGLHLRGFNLSRDLFSRTFPSLQNLYLHFFGVDWDRLPVTQGLKNIYLGYPRKSPTMDELSRIFQIIGPTLETLEFNQVFRGPIVAPSIHTGKFKFDNLKLLKLEERAEQTTVFLSHILLPRRLDVEINPGSEVDIGISPGSTSSRIHKWPVGVLQLRIEDNNLQVRIVEDWSSESTSYLPGHNQTDIQLEVTGTQSSIFLPIFDALPIRRPIEKVSLIASRVDPQDLTVLDYIGKLGTVQELYIEFSCWETFLSSIEPQTDELQTIFEEGEDQNAISDPEKIARARGIISFHDLRVLEIHSSYQGAPPAFNGEDVLALQNWFQWRKRAGFQLERLTLSSLLTPPISWMAGVFEGFVDKFQPNDLQERRSEDYEDEQ